LSSAFELFAPNSFSRLTVNDLLRGFEKLGVPCDLSDAELIIKRYDADEDDRLGFWEFSNSLMPNNTNLRDAVEQRESSHGSKEMTMEIKEELALYFKHLIEAEQVAETCRG